MKSPKPPAPLIGITTYGREAYDNGAAVLDIFRTPAAYSDAVQRGGGVPILLSPAIRDLPRLIELMEGLLLVGGGDINPARYGADRHPNVYSVDDERDAFEIELTRGMLQAGKPILGICRGIQLLNVALGGDLFQHLPDYAPGTVNHAGFPSPPQKHPVALEASSKLAAELELAAFGVTSWHHQAVNRVGTGLVVVGRAQDGIVEALELPSHSWCLAVQWHPELDAGVEPIHQRLFTRFVEAAQRETPHP